MYFKIFGRKTYPSIAQLAERETVEAKQLSLGHWFESGWTETFFICANDCQCTEKRRERILQDLEQGSTHRLVREPPGSRTNRF